VKCLWLTGLPASGKTTIAQGVVKRLRTDSGYPAVLLDGDSLRLRLNCDLDFSPEGRKEAVRRAGDVAFELLLQKVWPVVAMVSPFRSDRDRIRRLFPYNYFSEIYVQCSVKGCAARDPKGLYAKAQSGQLDQFTGISSRYEAPENPELVLDTELMTVEECVNAVFCEALRGTSRQR